MMMLICAGGFLGYTLFYAGVYNGGQYATAPWNALRGTQAGADGSAGHGGSPGTGGGGGGVLHKLGSIAGDAWWVLRP